MAIYKKFNVGHIERLNTNISNLFREIYFTPKVGGFFDKKRITEIIPVEMDCQQFRDDNFNYNLYILVCKYDDEDETTEELVCIRKEYDK